MASTEQMRAEALGWWRPPMRRKLSEWADEHFYLSPESAAEPGPWKTIPYQRGIMDAISDPLVERVSVMKSARLGYTKIIDATIGYYATEDPCPIHVVQPTLEDARGFSKEELEPMFRDVNILAQVMPPPATRDPNNAILSKRFPGGSLTIIGANSARGFRRVSRKVMIFDEVDGYPPSAGREGDQIRLGIKRTEYYWDRKIIAGSTPTIAGRSRIEEMFREGDQRRYNVPCPHCGHMDYLVFRKAERGHWMRWPEGKPELAHFVCSACAKEISESAKRGMVERGAWIAERPFVKHASFSIWAAYSYSPNATWRQIAEEFLSANAQGPEQLVTFVNTTLGETYVERGEAPPWESIYRRREEYEEGTVPSEAVLVTAGVDVQKDRLIYEIVAWLADKSSYSVAAGALPGKPSEAETWDRLTELLNGAWPDENGVMHAIRMMAVDAGNWAQDVYTWCRGHPRSRVIAVRGLASARTLIGSSTPVDVTVGGRKIRNGYAVWMAGVNIAKTELYGWLHLDPPLKAGQPYPPGYCHFPQSYDEEFFRQLTAEQLIPVKKRGGYVRMEWTILPNRENHALDARNYARCAAALCGLDRYAAAHARKHPRPETSTQASTPTPTSKPPPQAAVDRPSPRPKPTSGSGWLGRGGSAFGSGRGRGGWLRR